MVASLLAPLPAALRRFDPASLDELMEGLNAADVRRVVADLKALYARDVMEGCAVATTDTYLERATKNVRRTRELLRLAESRQLLLT
jgi:hypothetical protein